MPLPMLKKCCGCLSLEVGCLVVTLLSALACVANITFGSWNLPRHRERQMEDNLISLSADMFSTLSLISDLFVLFGMCMKRPGYLQLSLLFNSVFIVCIFLVAIVTCLFSPEQKHFFQSGLNIALVVLLLVAGAAFSFYYLLVVNSLYRKMKSDYSGSALPI